MGLGAIMEPYNCRRADRPEYRLDPGDRKYDLANRGGFCNIMAPVALDTAGLIGIEPKAFAVAVIVGAAGHIPAAGRPSSTPDGTESRVV